MRISAHLVGLDTRTVSGPTTSLIFAASASAFSPLVDPGTSNMRAPAAVRLKRRGAFMPRLARLMLDLAWANTDAYVMPRSSTPGCSVITTAVVRGA